ncbi:WD40 repeat protein [Giardia muris]|uniref:WD40 repeat protein n=1 Tax=Giardia muris TaxID=5742 RepID=A0A4Z1SPR6_GIAMU|nr:WD40 repeat protein [Giardia muris]|eukprot:TNJ27824.1 WD40 repeat protein [Giardia muris]
MELVYVNSFFYRRLGAHAVTITALTSANELGIVFFGLSNGAIAAWDLRYEPSPLARVVVYAAHQGSVLTLHWQPYYRLLVSGGADARVRIWDPSLTDFVDVSGTGAKKSALAQLFAKHGDNEVLTRHAYTVQPLGPDGHALYPDVSTSIRLTRLVQDLADFSRSITRVTFVAQYLVVLSADGYISCYRPGGPKPLAGTTYPVFTRLAHIFLGYAQLDKIRHFTTYRLGFSLKEPIHRDCTLEIFDCRIHADEFVAPESSQPHSKEGSRSVGLRARSVSRLDTGMQSREGLKTRSLSVTKSGEARVPQGYAVNPVLTQAITPTALALDPDNATLYVGDSVGNVHVLHILNNCVTYRSRLRGVANDAIISICALPEDSAIVVVAADGTARGLMAITGKRFMSRVNPRATAFTRAVHCPQRPVFDCEDLLSARPEAAKLAKQYRAQLEGSGRLLDAMEEAGAALDEQRMKLTYGEEQKCAENPTPMVKSKGPSIGSSVSRRKDSAIEKPEEGLRIDTATESQRRQSSGHVLLLDGNSVLTIVNVLANTTLFEGPYKDVGPLPSSLLAQATEAGVFLTTPVVTEPHRSRNHALYAIAKMSLSLQEEYWVLRGRFARTMDKLDHLARIEKALDSTTGHSPRRSKSKGPQRSSIESISSKVSATRVNIINQYDDLRVLDVVLLKLPLDLNPDREFVLGVVKQTCMDVFRLTYRGLTRIKGTGHTKPIRLLALMPAPVLPLLAPTELTDEKSAIEEAGERSALDATIPSGAISEAGPPETFEFTVPPNSSAAAATLDYYRRAEPPEISGMSESRNLDLLSGLDDPISEGYAQFQEQHRRSEFRRALSRQAVHADSHVNRILRGEMPIRSVEGASADPSASQQVPISQRVLQEQFASIASLASRALSPDRPMRAATSLAETRQSILRSLRTSGSRTEGSTATVNPILGRSSIAGSGTDNVLRQTLTIQDLETPEKRTPRRRSLTPTAGPTLFEQTVAQKRVTDALLQKANEPGTQVKQISPYLPPEGDIIQHIVHHHTDKADRLPLITRSGPRCTVQRRLAPPFFLVTASLDLQLYSWDARIVTRPYHHYLLDFDTLKYSRILNLASITGVVLDASSVLLHKYLVEAATTAARSAATDITSSYAFSMIQNTSLSRLLLGQSRNEEREATGQQVIEQTALSMRKESDERSAQLREIAKRVDKERKRKEAETRNEELFTRLQHGLSTTGKQFASTSQGLTGNSRAGNYTNYHVDESEMRARLLRLGKSGVLNKEATDALVKQTPVEIRFKRRTEQNLSFLDADRYYILHPDAIALATLAGEPVHRHGNLGISPYSSSHSMTLYGLVKQASMTPDCLVCDWSSLNLGQNEGRVREVAVAQAAGVNFENIVNEEREQAQQQISQQISFEIRRIAELPQASVFCMVEPFSFLIIGHEDGSLTSIQMDVKVNPRGESKGTTKNILRDKRTSIFRVLAGHAEAVTCLCTILTEQGCLAVSAGVDGSLLMLAYNGAEDFRFQYVGWTRFRVPGTKAETDNNISKVLMKTSRVEENTPTDPSNKLVEEASRIPEAIEFLQGTKGFLIIGTNLRNIYLLPLPLQYNSAPILFFQTDSFMKSYRAQICTRRGETRHDREKEEAFDSVHSLQSMHYSGDTLVLVLESGYVLRFDGVSLYFRHLQNFLATGRHALSVDERDHYFSRIVALKGTTRTVLEFGFRKKSESPPEDTFLDRGFIPAPPVSQYYPGLFETYLPLFPFKLIPTEVISVYSITTRRPIPADNILELERRAQTLECVDNPITCLYVCYPVNYDEFCAAAADEAQGGRESVRTHRYHIPEDVLRSYGCYYSGASLKTAEVSNLLIIDGEPLRRPVSKILDAGQRFYDGSSGRWRPLVESEQEEQTKPQLEAQPSTGAIAPTRRPPSILQKTRTTSLRYVDTDTTSQTGSKVAQALSNPTSLKTRQATIEALQPLAATGPLFYFTGYASGHLRIIGREGAVIHEATYDSPVTSVRMIQADPVGLRILLDTMPQNRPTILATFWVGLEDGRLMMARCDSLVVSWK